MLFFKRFSIFIKQPPEEAIKLLKDNIESPSPAFAGIINGLSFNIARHAASRWANFAMIAGSMNNVSRGTEITITMKIKLTYLAGMLFISFFAVWLEMFFLTTVFWLYTLYYFHWESKEVNKLLKHIYSPEMV